MLIPDRSPRRQWRLRHRAVVVTEYRFSAFCRRHHRLKQHPHWTVTQPQPGVFSWTTPAARTYTTHPHQYYTG